MNYVFRYKRLLLWKSVTVKGHRFDHELGKMVIFFPDGSVQEIPHWKNYHLRLGTDWVLAIQKSMEEQAGQAVVVKQ